MKRDLFTEAADRLLMLAEAERRRAEKLETENRALRIAIANALACIRDNPRGVRRAVVRKSLREILGGRAA